MREFTPCPKPPKTQRKSKKPLPKRSKRWKPATKKEREHLAKIKSLPCIACSAPPPTEAHHITVCGRRLGHLFALSLCHECHEGEFSIGNAKKRFIEKYGTELFLLQKVNELLKSGEKSVY
jgi:hypothetical protein